MSMVEYSLSSQNLVTVSMHNYEREEFKVREKWEKDPLKLERFGI
jgi:hypothetical protein